MRNPTILIKKVRFKARYGIKNKFYMISYNVEWENTVVQVWDHGNHTTYWVNHY